MTLTDGNIWTYGRHWWWFSKMVWSTLIEKGRVKELDLLSLKGLGGLWGSPTCCGLQIPNGMVQRQQSQTSLIGAKWWTKRQLTQDVMVEISIGYHEKCFYHEGGQTLKERWWNIPWRYSELNWTKPRATWCNEPAFGLDQMTSFQNSLPT